jgi:cytochrome c5
MYNYLDLKIDSQGRTGSASLFNLTAAFVMLLLLASGVVNAADRTGDYGLGAAASPEEISGSDIDIRPDIANGRCMQDCTDPASIRIVSSVMPVVQDTAPSIIDNRAAEAAGEKIYGQYCSLCHKSGMGGAPVVGEVSDWQGRAAAGMVALKKRAIDGYTGRYGFMPPKGGFTHLTDQEIEAVVEYMMDSSQ